VTKKDQEDKKNRQVRKGTDDAQNRYQRSHQRAEVTLTQRKQLLGGQARCIGEINIERNDERAVLLSLIGTKKRDFDLGCPCRKNVNLT